MNYHYTLRNIAEGCRSHLLRGGILKSRLDGAVLEDRAVSCNGWDLKVGCVCGSGLNRTEVNWCNKTAELTQTKNAVHMCVYIYILKPFITVNYFNVHGSVHRKYIPVYFQQDATLRSLFISGNFSTCFGWYLYPSSGAQTTVFTVSVICHTVTAICRYRGRPLTR
jgi:hypothetical protein